MFKVSPDTTNESCIFFVWPLDIVHVIDKVSSFSTFPSYLYHDIDLRWLPQDSPFYDMSAADMARERFELLMVMEGTNDNDDNQ